MNKKVRLFTVITTSVLVLAVPAMASALVPSHVVPVPSPSAFPYSGGTVTLTTVNGNFLLICEKMTASATWENGTTGTTNITLVSCRMPPGTTEIRCNDIKIENAQFHLVTLSGGSPGVLITPPPSGIFFKVTCAAIVPFELKGNGLIGTIKSPKCGESRTTMNIDFQSGSGRQQHQLVSGTETNYHLLLNGEEAALQMNSILTFAVSTKLECT